MAVVPALPDTERRTVYTIAAQAGPFDVGFAVYGNGTDYGVWFEVWLDGVELAPYSDWIAAPSSGTFATAERPMTNVQISLLAARTGSLIIIGADRPRRTVQVQESQGVTARDFNQAITHAVARQREMWDRWPRTVRLPANETTVELPPIAERALKGAAFDASGNMIAGTLETGSLVSSVMEPVVAAGSIEEAHEQLGLRRILTTHATYFVNSSTGNDSTNDGLSPSTPFATIQKAINTIMWTVETRGFNVTISVADGTYTGDNQIIYPTTGPPMDLLITGNTSTPSSVLISTTNTCFTISGHLAVTLTGMKFVSSAGGAIGLNAYARCAVSAVDFGACGAFSHIGLDGWATILLAGSYTISGATGAHIHVPGPGYVYAFPITITLTGLVNLSSYFIGMRGPSYAYLAPVTFAGGSITGAQFRIHFGAILDCEGKSRAFIPGTFPGAANDGAMYIGTTTIFSNGNGFGNVAANGDVSIEMVGGLIWFDDLSGGSALVSYSMLTGTPTPTIAWQTGGGRFTTGADPGPGTTTWWLQPGGLIKSRFSGFNSLTYAILAGTG